jgi:NitT/TauT family transport system substrate-binding protein
MRNFKRSRMLLAAACTTAIAVMAGCGGDDASEKPAAGAASGGGNAAELVKIKVGILPSANAAPFHLGIKKGFFKEEGLDVEPQVMQGGSELTTALVSGATQISHLGVINEIIARSKGLPIKMITSYLEDETDPEKSFMQVVVPKGSPIKSVKDLAGKTIAANEVRAYGETVVKASLEKQGVDPNSIKITEIPFPEMPAALAKGQVDAAWVLEPFLSIALAEGATRIDSPSVTLGGGKNFVDGGWIATEKYIASDRDIVDRFVRAMNKSTEYAAANEQEVRDIIPTVSKVKPEAAKTLRLPHFDTQLDPELFQQAVDYVAKYGIIDRKPTREELLLNP